METDCKSFRGEQTEESGNQRDIASRQKEGYLGCLQAWSCGHSRHCDQKGGLSQVFLRLGAERISLFISQKIYLLG